MELEKKVNYHHFKSEYEKILVNIYYTNNWLFDNYQKILKKYNLTTQQFNVLKILFASYQKPLMISSIKERMLDKNSDITRIVERLFVKNLVTRRRNQSNRRKVFVRLSIKGYQLMKKMNKEVQVFEKLVNHLTPKEAVELNILLNKIRKKSA
ncbi:MAG: MarR family winged helix-turn-helix transcriptional regulator [Bacteroidota bacterium]